MHHKISPWGSVEVFKDMIAKEFKTSVSDTKKKQKITEWLITIEKSTKVHGISNFTIIIFN